MTDCIRKSSTAGDKSLLHRVRLLRLETAALSVATREALHPEKPVSVDIPEGCSQCFNRILNQTRQRFESRRTA